MDLLQTPAAPATNTTPDAVSQPYTLPADMSPEAAHQRLSDLRHDTEWGKRAMIAGSREAHEFDALVLHGSRRGMTAPAAVQSTPAAVPPQQSSAGPEAVAAARARLDELKADKGFADKVISDPKGPEGREWDRLVQVASG